MNIKISPSKVTGSITAPASKSYTHRAVLLASLAKGESTIRNILIASDTKRTISICKKVGADIKQNGTTLKIKGVDGFQMNNQKGKFIEFFGGNSGTSIRFVTSLAALRNGDTEIKGDERMRKRPMSELVEALRKQGIQVKDTKGSLPMIVTGGKLKGGRIEISGKQSSQFVSSLLVALPYAQSKSEVIVSNLQSKPYVDITIDLMRAFGVKVGENNGIYRVPKGAYRYANYEVEGDFSSASYFLAAAAITGSSLEILGLNPYSKQGDKILLEILEEMGCTIEKVSAGIKISGKAVNPVSLDMADYPDIVPTVASIAATISAETTIKNIAHLRHKESDRIDSMEKELTKMGAEIKSTADSLTIRGGPLHVAEIDTHNDHRIAMSMAIAALVAKGDTIIKDAQVVEKSYKNFWKDLKKIGVQLKIV